MQISRARRNKRGYSVCMIDANASSAAGRGLNSALFVPKRVINRDASNVHIS